MNQSSSGKQRSWPEIQEVLAEYNASGETQRDFAREHGIGVSTLSLWLRRARENGGGGAGRWCGAKMVEVSVSRGAEPGRHQPGGDFEIEFAGGERLRMRRGFLAEEFRVIVAVLRRQEGR